MKKLKLSDLNLGNAEVLTREQLKKVLGGGWGSGGSGISGTRCAIYCCDSAGNCTFEGDFIRNCTSHEECQTWAVEHGASCSGGDYVIARCKE